MYFFCVSRFIFFLLPHRLSFFPVLVTTVCGQMKWISAPDLGQRAAHLGGTVLRLLDEMYSSSSGVEAPRFLRSSVLPYFKPANASTGRTKRSKRKTEHSCFIAWEGAEKEVEQLYWTFLNFFEDLGQPPCPRGTTSQVSSRFLWNIFSNFESQAIQLAIMDIFLDSFYSVFFLLFFLL